MAWTEQAWRYSLAGSPDPAQSLDEQQTHLSLVWVANASDLAEIDPWDYDESLTLTITPHPAGWDVTTRYALANVPAVNLSDSVDRDGALTPTLSTFSPDFDGTVTVPTFDGDLVVTLGVFSAALGGEFTYRHYFDISYSITPTWVVYEQPARFGDLTPTLSGFTTDLSGYALPPDSTQGRVSFAVSGFTADLDGTFTAAQSYDGDIGLDIEGFSASVRGTAVPPQGVVGSIGATLDGFTQDFTGTFAVWSTDGAWSSTLGDYTLSFEGAFITAGANNGVFQATLGGFDSSLTGVGPLSITLTSKEAVYKAKARHRRFKAAQRDRLFRVT